MNITSKNDQLSKPQTTQRIDHLNKTQSSINPWRGLSIAFAVVSFIPFFMGFYKMLAYENSDSLFASNVNAYVGGDAYNYIINASYTTAFFVLTGVLVLAAIGCGIMWYLHEIKNCDNAPDLNSSLPQL